MRGFVDHGGGHGAVNLMDRYDGRLLLDFIPAPRDNGGRHKQTSPTTSYNAF